MVLPAGSINLGEICRSRISCSSAPRGTGGAPGLNSALSDLLLEVAQEVHGKANMLQKSGEFPAPLGDDITMSDDALRYYKSGKGLLARTVGSFWLASLLNRALVVFLR